MRLVLKLIVITIARCLVMTIGFGAWNVHAFSKRIVMTIVFWLVKIFSLASGLLGGGRVGIMWESS